MRALHSAVYSVGPHPASAHREQPLCLV